MGIGGSVSVAKVIVRRFARAVVGIILVNDSVDGRVSTSSNKLSFVFAQTLMY